MNELSILYKDDNLIAVNKPAGFMVHPADHPQSEDQVAMKILRDQIGRRVDPIHRIDRPTSGVLLFSLNVDFTKKMNLLMDRREIKKTYIALVEGHCLEDFWICNDELRRKDDSPLLDAMTQFRVLERAELHDQEFSLLECCPSTGRYHQIRRHLSGAGYPIVGDYLYAGIEVSDYLGELLGSGTRMFLQAKSLEFIHPSSGRNLKISAPTDSIFLNCSLGLSSLAII